MNKNHERSLIFVFGFFSNLLITLLFTWGLGLGGLQIPYTLTSSVITMITVYLMVKNVQLNLDIDIKHTKKRFRDKIRRDKK